MSDFVPRSACRTFSANFNFRFLACHGNALNEPCDVHIALYCDSIVYPLASGYRGYGKHKFLFKKNYCE